MPIITADGLPINQFLQEEGVFGIPTSQALHQDIRPLEFGLLNLMPRKQPTELQFARLLGHTPLQVNLTLLRVQSHASKNESSDHLHKFYQTMDDVHDRNFDGLIITGAPVEHLQWQEVDYWDELTEIFDWSARHAFMTIGICWGAQALLHHFNRIEKHVMPQKRYGLYPHSVPTDKRAHPLVQGLDDTFLVPVSRHTEIRKEDIEAESTLEILADSEESGLFLLSQRDGRRLFLFNHPEYDSGTLHEEYERDMSAHSRDPKTNAKPNPPLRYDGRNLWRANGRTLYHNIVNDIYQRTPYRLEDISKISTKNHPVALSCKTSDCLVLQ